MKTFLDDKPLMRYMLFAVGAVVCSFVGTTTAFILFGVLLKR